MIVRTSAKSRLIRPGSVTRSEMPCTPWRSTSSATRKASTIDTLRSSTDSRRLFGTTISVSTSSAQRGDPGLGLVAAARALELERPGDDADGQRAELAGDLGDDRRGAGARATARAGGDEHHVRAAQHRLDPVVLLARRARPSSGFEPEPRPRVTESPMCSVSSAAETCRDCILPPLLLTIIQLFHELPQFPDLILISQNSSPYHYCIHFRSQKPWKITAFRFATHLTLTNVN